MNLDDLDIPALRRRRSTKWSHYPSDVIPAWVAEMDFPLAEPVREAVIAAALRDDFGYPPFLQDTGFREVVAAWAERSYGWQVEPESVIVLPDVVRALSLSLEALTRPGDRVVIQPPVYPPFFTVIKESGRTLVENPLVMSGGRYEVDLLSLDQALSRAAAFILCNPQNPTGRSFSREELEAMATLAIKHDVVVISDEVHSQLSLPGTTHTVFATLNEELSGRTMTVTAASKSWNFGGLKCGLAIPGTPAMGDKMSALGTLALHGASIVGILATEAALTQGGPWMSRIVDYLDGSRRLLGELLGEHLPEVGYALPEATYLAWLDCRALGLKPDPFTFFLDRARVALSPGENFGSQGKGFVRLNYATSRPIITEIVHRMAAAVRAR
ncbi:MAG: MalY/PatB family protein [Actinomycetota bacterium]